MTFDYKVTTAAATRKIQLLFVPIISMWIQQYPKLLHICI